jgi:hypothetical protein
MTRHAVITLLMLSAAAAASAKLPPPSDEAKAKAAEAATKSAWASKVDAFKLCKSMDQVAARYHGSMKTAGTTVAAPVATPPCADPGPFVAASETKPPIEQSGAHSPARTATAPPSTTTPQSSEPKK